MFTCVFKTKKQLCIEKHNLTTIKKINVYYFLIYTYNKNLNVHLRAQVNIYKIDKNDVVVRARFDEEDMTCLNK